MNQQREKENHENLFPCSQPSALRLTIVLVVMVIFKPFVLVNYISKIVVVRAMVRVATSRQKLIKMGNSSSRYIIIPNLQLRYLHWNPDTDRFRVAVKDNKIEISRWEKEKDLL